MSRADNKEIQLHGPVTQHRRIPNRIISDEGQILLRFSDCYRVQNRLFVAESEFLIDLHGTCGFRLLILFILIAGVS